MILDEKEAIEMAIKAYETALKEMPRDEEWIDYLYDKSLDYGICYYMVCHNISIPESILFSRYGIYITQTPKSIQLKYEYTLKEKLSMVVETLKFRLEFLKNLNQQSNG